MPKRNLSELARYARQKGVRGELEAALHVSELTGLAFERSAQRSGKATADVRQVSSGYKLPFHLEIKHGTRVPKAIYQFYHQARVDAGDAIPVVLVRRVEPKARTKTPRLAIINLDDLPAILRELWHVMEGDLKWAKHTEADD